MHKYAITYRSGKVTVRHILKTNYSPYGLVADLIKNGFEITKGRWIMPAAILEVEEL